MSRLATLSFVFGCALNTLASAEAPRRVDVAGLFDTADARLRNRVTELSAYSDLRWPIACDASATTWIARAPLEWDSGYFPGTLWQMYRRTGNGDYLGWAKKWTNGLIGLGANDAIPTNLDAYTLGPTGHDVGIVAHVAFGEGFDTLRAAGYDRVVNRAAAQLRARITPSTGTIRSWDWGPWTNPVIIDGMMSVQALNWSAAHGGDGSNATLAASHAHASAVWNVRADGSTFHVVDFGRSPPAGSTYQGFSDTSTWARGEAWAIHGFTASAVANPADATLVDAARRSADYFLAHTTDDAVPLWDLNLPVGGSASLYRRDSSAAAIAASGLIHLSLFTDRAAEQRRYFQAAERILNRLGSAAYLAPPSPGQTRLLLHGVGSYNSGSALDADLIYSDYFFLDALEQYDKIFPGPGIIGGDANRDGSVDFDDLLILAQHYGSPAPIDWLGGDFTRDDAANFDDLLVLAKHYGSAASFEADWTLAQSLVPEPCVVAGFALVFSSRRRRTLSS